MVAGHLLDALAGFGTILSIKLYRLTLDARPPIPILPCLDHEAMLHEGIAPHLAAYVAEAGSGDLHELVFIPDQHRVEVDTVSTWQEHSAESRDRLLAFLQRGFPTYRVRVVEPSWWRGEARVANACRAQVTLRQVLTGDDLDAIKAQVDRLALVGTLMEKHSRYASWGVRTIMSPLLGAAGVVLIFALGSFEPQFGDWLTMMRYALLTLLGGWFLYYGVKAVQLTDMANRVWKRSAEYGLILAERKRLRAGESGAMPSFSSAPPRSPSS